MNVNIHHFEDLPDDGTSLLAACMERIRRFYGDSQPQTPVEIFCNGRDRDGFLEVILRLPYSSHQGHMTIGAIQRLPGAECEFHS
jgi:hypothetical protein